MADDGDEGRPLYEKEVLSGPKLHTLMMGADSDEQMDKIRRSLEYHGMNVPPGLSSRRRGGKIKGAKSKHHPGRKVRSA